MQQKKETRGRKALPANERRVTLRVGIKIRHRAEVQKVLNELKAKYS